MVSIKEVVTVSVLLSFCGAYKQEKLVSCPSCMHVYYKVSNVPSYFKIILDRSMSKFVNKACAHNTVEPDVCPRPLIPRLLENTCQHTTVTVVAKGLKNISAKAELKMTMIYRMCTMVTAGKKAGCTDLMTLPECDRPFRAFKILEASWTNVTQTCQICKGLA